MREESPEGGTISVSTPKLVFGEVRPQRRQLKKARQDGQALLAGLFNNESAKSRKRGAPSLPSEDNTSEGLRALMAANAQIPEDGLARTVQSHYAPAAYRRRPRSLVDPGFFGTSRRHFSSLLDIEGVRAG